MNEHALLHIMDSAYSYALSSDEAELRLRCAKGDAQKVNVVYECKYDFNRRQKRCEMAKTFSDRLYDYYTVRLKLDDVRLTYVFEIFGGGQKYFFSEDGLSKSYDFTLAYFNCFQLPYINSADVHRRVKWLDGSVFYLIFVDRFCPSKDKNGAYVNLQWGDIPTPTSFAGGDLDGIASKLDYIQALGVTALYLTPVFSSVSNHKYDTSDYGRVDGQFGSLCSLKNLAEGLHTRGMRLVLDAVFNHASEHLAQFQDVLEKGEQSAYRDWFFIKKYAPSLKDMELECFSSCKYMPKLNTSNPEVQRFLLDNALYFTRELKLDGWRLDVSDEVSHDFWRLFRKEIKRIDPEIVIIGENWHNAEASLRGDRFDSIMNYAVTKAAMDYFALKTISASAFQEKLSGIYMRNTLTANGMMLNLLDNHDTHRFISTAGGNLKRLKAALAFIYLYDGNPCVYYGTEIALSGGYDPDNRRCMDWAQAEKGHEVMRLIQALGRLRSEGRVCGDIAFDSMGDVFILSRNKGEIKLFVNMTEQKTELSLGTEKIELDGEGFAVYDSNRGRIL